MAKSTTDPAASDRTSTPVIAAVIPCYREKAHVLDVIRAIGPEVSKIIAVDDACPDGTGAFISEMIDDDRVVVIRHDINKGVGGATMTGYKAALEMGIDIVVKVDGDGQMEPALIPDIARPVIDGEADYAKGNRLHRREAAQGMPLIRLVGNMALTLCSKLSSGYWSIMDPTNGYTAIHTAVIRELPLDDIAPGYYFESDMLFHLGLLDAVVQDVPMRARYGAEDSHLSIRRIFWRFLRGHLSNGWRRLIDTYLVRDAGIATVEFILGTLLLIGGIIFGAINWAISLMTGETATAGTVVLAALPILIGVQLLIAFIGHDTRREPTHPIHPSLLHQDRLKSQ
jgi:dolichol-phosphate mannosyltransferase